MSSVQNLRALINERLTAAAEEILTEFEKTIVQYEEEIDRQRRLLDITWNPQVTLQTTDPPQQNVYKKEEVLTEQNVCNHERISNLDRENTEPPQMKEEQEELCNSQDGQQLVSNRKADTFMLVQWPNEAKCEEFPGENARVSDNTTGQYEKEINHQHRLLNITQKPQIELHRIDLQQQDVYKQEVFADDQLCKQDRNCSLNQKDPELPQIKERRELCSSQEGEQFVLKQETDSFMVISTYEESDNSEPRPNTGKFLYHNSPLVESPDQERSKHPNSVSASTQQTDTSMVTPSYAKSDHSKTKPITCQLLYQLLTHNCPLAENADQDGSKHAGSGSTSNVVLKSKKKHDRDSSHRSFVSEVHYYAAKRKKTITCSHCGKTFQFLLSLKRHVRIHKVEKPFACETCGKSFTHNYHLKLHMRIHTDEKLYLCKTCGEGFHDPF